MFWVFGRSEEGVGRYRLHAGACHCAARGDSASDKQVPGDMLHPSRDKQVGCRNMESRSGEKQDSEVDRSVGHYRLLTEGVRLQRIYRSRFFRTRLMMFAEQHACTGPNVLSGDCRADAPRGTAIFSVHDRQVIHRCRGLLPKIWSCRDDDVQR